MALVSAVRDARLPLVLLIATRDANPPQGVDAPTWLGPATRPLGPLDNTAMRAVIEGMVELATDEARGNGNGVKTDARLLPGRCVDRDSKGAPSDLKVVKLNSQIGDDWRHERCHFVEYG
jgi:hypothetical protein